MKNILTKLVNTIDNNRMYHICCTVYCDGTYIAYDRKVSYNEALEWVRNMFKKHAHLHKGDVY